MEKTEAGLKGLSIREILTTVFPLTEARSQIQAGSLTEAGGLKANIIEIAERRYGLPVFRFAVINTKPRILMF